MIHARTTVRTRRAAHPKREGAALLIVLFILMMATATAVYSMQSTQFEQRAAGSLKQAMRTKYIAEAATVSVLGMCLELGTTGCVDLKHGVISDIDRQRFGLPDWGKTEIVTTVNTKDMVGTTWPITILPTDAALGGRASPFKPDFLTEIEEWKVPNPGETRPRFRLIVSTYGLLNLGAGNDVMSSNDFRQAHESVSATRAFFDVR